MEEVWPCVVGRMPNYRAQECVCALSASTHPVTGYSAPVYRAPWSVMSIDPSIPMLHGVFLPLKGWRLHGTILIESWLPTIRQGGLDTPFLLGTRIYIGYGIRCEPKTVESAKTSASCQKPVPGTPSRAEMSVSHFTYIHYRKGVAHVPNGREAPRFKRSEGASSSS